MVLHWPRRRVFWNKLLIMLNKIDKKELGLLVTTPLKGEFHCNARKKGRSTECDRQLKDKQNMSAMVPEINLVNPENERGPTSQETFNKLIEMNKQYLYQKIKISDVPTPPKFSHKIPSKTGKSQYYLKYGSTRGHSVPERKLLFDQSKSKVKVINQNITGYQSVYHQDYAEKASESVGKTEKAKYRKSEAPTFNQSSYHRDYGTIKASPTTSAKRAEVKLMGGGQLSADTTYKQNYRMKTEGYKPINPIIQKNNRIFMTLNGQVKGSSYRQNFNETSNRKKMPIESCKPKQQYSPNPMKLKYKTEYNGEYVERQLTQNKVIECLSPDELKKYVMNILND